MLSESPKYAQYEGDLPQTSSGGAPTALRLHAGEVLPIGPRRRSVSGMTSHALISRFADIDLYTATLAGQEYLRVSKDRSGRRQSVESQHEDNTGKCERRRITLGTPYCDNDKSASKFAKKTRDDFLRLMADLESGAFTADVLVLWESSRGSRDVGEWASLLTLLERRGKGIYVTTHDRFYDPANGRDRKSLIEDASDSEYESYKTSRRTVRDVAVHAAQGRPYGKAPHGYMPTYDPKTGKLINWVENPAESMVPKKLFAGIRAGHSLRSITRAFEAAGYLNRSGKPFTQTHLRTMATKHAYAGIRNHKGTEYAAAWNALIDREVWHDVQRIISNATRKTSRNGRAKHEITMVIKCDVCGGPLNSRTDKSGTRLVYMCMKNGCIRIDKDEVDEIVIGKMLGYLALPDLYESLAAPSADDARVMKVRADLAEARQNLDEMEAETPKTLTEARILAKAIDASKAEITELEAAETELTMPSVLVGILAPGTDVAEWWADAPISARREVAKIILTPGLLGEVRVKRAVRRKGRTPAAERIVWQQAA